MNAEELKALVGDPEFYDRWAKEGRWSFIATLAGRHMQSAEQNELQHVLEEKIRAVGRATYADGTILRGCAITIDRDVKVARMDAGLVVIDGLPYEVEAATLSIPEDAEVKIGIALSRRVVTEAEDPTLRDPAKGWPGYQQPGAYRVIEEAEWAIGGIETQGRPFYPIYNVSSLQIVSQAYNENQPDWMDALARYDRDSHGHYVVEGLRVTALDPLEGEEGRQAFSVGEGLAHVRGWEARLPATVRLVVDEDAPLYDVQSEAHEFDGGGTGAGTITTHHAPIEEIKQVRVTKSWTVEIVHGTYTGCADPLPHTSVTRIVEISDDERTYEQGRDFRLDANKVDWSPAGLEPPTGARYVITYHYRMDVRPDAVGRGSIDLSEIVEGSLVEIDYSYRLPRRDIIVIYRDSSVELIKGIPHRYAPVLPKTPPEALCLAEVEQTWAGRPVVKETAMGAVRMDELNKMKAGMRDLYNLCAKQEMRVDALISAPASAFGVFVDPFIDDDMRDTGTPQTAWVAGQLLRLPMDMDARSFGTGGPLSRPRAHAVLIDQPLRSRDMLVNPYNAFEPLPAVVTLDPAIDRWTVSTGGGSTSFSWGGTSVSATTFFQNAARPDATNVSVSVSSSTSIQNDVPGILRQIDVKVSSPPHSFDMEEPVRVTFSGVPVTCDNETAGADGSFEGTFRIPRNIPTGSHAVEAKSPTTSGRATFTGTMDRVSTWTSMSFSGSTAVASVDPLAQTFSLDESRHVSGADVWIGTKGTSPLVVEIRECQLGLPTQTVLAETRPDIDALRADGWNRVEFDPPPFLMAGVEYALVLKSDSDEWTAGIVEVGDWIEGQGFSRTQAYQTGVLLSSSNASTWTSHQFADLTFRLLGADHGTAPHEIPLGTVDLTGVTDVCPLAEVEISHASDEAEFILRKAGRDVARMQAWQAVAFAEPLEGEHELVLELRGDARNTPIVGRDPQLATAKIQTKGDYVSRSFPCGTGRRVMVTTDELVPSGASVRVWVGTSETEWTEGAVAEETPIGNGWVRRIRFVPCGAALTRLKIELEGDAAARPLVANLSGVILDAI